MKNKDSANDSLIPSQSNDQRNAGKEAGFNVHAPSVSGAFIKVLQVGKFEKTNVLVDRYQKARKRLENVEGQLLACNSEEHLFEFGRYCCLRHKDTEAELRKLVK